MIRNNWTNFAQCCLARKKMIKLKSLLAPLIYVQNDIHTQKRTVRWNCYLWLHLLFWGKFNIDRGSSVHQDKMGNILYVYIKPIFIPWHNLAIIQFYGRRFYLIFWGLLWDTYQNNEGKRTKTGENGVIGAKKCRQISKWLRDIKFEGWLWDANSN